MVFFFTATGNSLYAAKALDDHPVSIAQAIHDRDKTYRDERIGIVCPVFGHEAPQLVKDFLKASSFETDYFYMILTYGNRHGGASELAEKMLKSLGIEPAYINIVHMVDNFLPSFDMDEQKKLDKNEDGQIEAIRKDINAKRRFISPVTDQDRAGHREFLERVSHMPRNAFGSRYRITDACVGCGICAKVCPKSCFSVTDQKSSWDLEGCISCMACIHACPTMAIQLNIPEKNPNARYRNEHISICEIINANNQNKEQ